MNKDLLTDEEIKEFFTWLNEPCNGSSHLVTGEQTDWETKETTKWASYYSHRYLCPDCREEIGLK